MTRERADLGRMKKLVERMLHNLIKPEGHNVGLILTAMFAELRIVQDDFGMFQTVLVLLVLVTFLKRGVRVICE